MTREQLTHALSPVSEAVGRLLDLAESPSDLPAQASRCLLAVQLMAAHAPEELAELDGMLSGSGFAKREGSSS
jgi:hypothetical protein